MIYVIVALETQAHIVDEAEKSWNIFRHVLGRYSPTFELPVTVF